MTTLTDNWVQVAPQLNGQINIHCLVVFNNELYGGTSNSGCLFKWNGTNAWVQVAPQLGTNADIYSLTVLNGKIYGIADPGSLLQWNGVNAWVQVAPQLNGQGLYSSVVFNGSIFAASTNGTNSGRLFRWNGTNAWIQVAPQLNGQETIFTLAVFNGALYGGTQHNPGLGPEAPSGLLFKWNGANVWIQVAPWFGTVGYCNFLFSFNNELYGLAGGGSSEGYSNVLLKWNGTNAWTQVAVIPGGSLGQGAQCAIEFNGKLYLGGSGIANLMEFDGVSTVNEVAPVILNEITIWQLIEFNGNLYGGTGLWLGNLWVYSPSL